MQELIELKKQKKIIHALKLEILALAADLELKVIEPADEESKIIEAVEKAMKQLKDEYIEVEIDENKSQISKYSLKSQELNEKLQKLQKLYKGEADVKNSQVESPPQIVRTSPTESFTSNSPKNSKKDSKSKKNPKEKLLGNKKENKNKKEWHITLLPVWIKDPWTKVGWSRTERFGPGPRINVSNEVSKSRTGPNKDHQNLRSIRIGRSVNPWCR